ncbi:hypothetical protein ACQ4PT_000271 [Festuca glaucescens]
METIGEEILRKILLKLPTRDVARSSYVSRLWSLLLRDPSFRRLHGKAAHIVSGSGGGTAPETLLITEIRDEFKGLEMIVRNISMEKPLCHVTGLARAYGPANACNGFILFESCVEGCLYVCNPIAGEKLKIAPPPEAESRNGHSYAMGFSPSTGQYKLFCLFFFHGMQDGYMDVCTLNDGASGWRRHPHPFCVTSSTHAPPVLIDGKLYVVTQHSRNFPEKVLVIDVSSEAHCTYLPPEFNGEKVARHAFDLDGRLCIAERILDDRRLYFWVMPPLQGRRLVDRKNDQKLGWELLYCFYLDKGDANNDRVDCPRGVWVDNDDRTLCYRQGDRIYKYDTTTENKAPPGCFLKWDHRILAPATATPKVYQDDDKRWNIYGGYRPSLLSPRLAFPSMWLQQPHDEEEHSQNALVHALRCKNSSNKRFSACSPHCAGDRRAVKRTRKRKPIIRQHNR